jgi:hypothetical protein
MRYDTRARLRAVEVLLADPETLGNDALETDLYLLREQLTGIYDELAAPFSSATGAPPDPDGAPVGHGGD